MRTLIVDDEAPARERLKRLLSEIARVELVGEASDGIQAVEMIETLSPDLVLLDIQMPGLDGFGVVEALDDPPPIIFVTAYDQYAVRAFEINALDYLLKPFSRERLERAIHRAQTVLAEDPAFTARLRSLLDNLAAQGQHPTRLAVRDHEHIRILDTDDIDWIGLDGEQAMVHVGDAAYPIRHSLAELSSRLNPAAFFRAHRAVIVNLNRVQEIVPWFKGSHRLRLTTGAELDLSRAQARMLRKILGW